MRIVKYKGYSGSAIYDDEAHIFHGEVINTRDVITFQGKSVDELEHAFKDSIDDYLAYVADREKTQLIVHANETPIGSKSIAQTGGSA